MNQAKQIFKNFLLSVLLAAPISPSSEGYVSVERTDNHRWTLIPDSKGRMHLVDLDPLDLTVDPVHVPEDDFVFLLFTRRNPSVGKVIGFDVA